MGAGPTILTWVGSTLVHIQVASPPREASETGTGVGGIACDTVINALATIEARTQDQAHRGWASSILNAQRPGTPTLVVVSTSAMSAVRDPGMLK